MSGIRLEIDTTKISLAKLKDLYRYFEKKHRWEGGQATWLLLLEKAIESHPENATLRTKKLPNVRKNSDLTC